VPAVIEHIYLQTCTPIRAYVIFVYTYAYVHATLACAYSYMHLDIYTRICICVRIYVCTFVMRGDSRHIHIYIRTCCDRAHLFTNKHAYSANVIYHARRLETHSLIHTYMPYSCIFIHALGHLHAHTYMFMHICMCIFVMRGDSRHIHIYIRSCCASAHLFTNMHNCTRICHTSRAKTRDILLYAYVHATLVHIHTCAWTSTRAHVYVYAHMYVYIRDARRLETHSHVHTCVLC
jgi:hypothetical protein